MAIDDFVFLFGEGGGLGFSNRAYGEGAGVDLGYSI